MGFVRALFVTTVIVLGTGASVSANAKLPSPAIEHLPNGLEVAWFIDHRVPLIDCTLVVPAGGRSDPFQRSGVSELTTSLLDRGAGGVDWLTLARSIEKLGASRFTWSSPDTMALGISGGSEDAPFLIELLANMALRPEFPQSEFDKIKKSTLEAWSLMDQDAEALASLAFRRFVQNGTTYGRGGYFRKSDFERIQRDDVLKFHEKFFKPKGALLVVVGDVDPATFRPLLEAQFREWTGSAPKVAFRANNESVYQTRKGQVIVIDRPDAPQAEIRLGFQAPTASVPERYDLRVAVSLFGDLFTSRLNRVLRDEMGLTYSAQAALGFERELGVLEVATSTRNAMVGRTLRKALDLLEGLQQGSFEEAEVSAARDFLVGSFPLRHNTVWEISRRWLAGWIHKQGPDFLNEFVPRISGATRVSTERAVRKHFYGKRPILVVAGDARALAVELKKSGFTDLKILRPKDFR